MDLNTQKEEFSYAYIHAITSVAGFSFQLKSRPMDNAGVDATIEMPGISEDMLFPKLDLQVKCTASHDIIDRDKGLIKYSLPVNNYNRLRHENSLIPIILVIVFVPKDVIDWVSISELDQETLLKKCAYWISLKGEQKTTNNTNKTIEIPLKNIFIPDSLKSIMEKIAREEEL